MIPRRAPWICHHKEPLLQRYYHTVNNVIAKFVRVTVEHIPRHENERADALSRLASSKKQSHHRSVVQMRLPEPSMCDVECMAVTETHTWMSPIIQYLEHGTCQPGEEKSIWRQCARYTMISQDLYRRGYSTPLLKFLTKEQSHYVLQEIHDGACRSHFGTRSMAAKVIRAGYYWPTVHGDCAEYVKKCQKMPRVRPPSPLEARGTAQHDVTLTVCHVGNGHHRTILTWKGPDKAPTGRCRLFHKMDRGRGPIHYNRSQRSKLCVEKHSVPVRYTTLDSVRQRPTVHRPRPHDLLQRPRHQIPHKFRRTSTNKRTSRSSQESPAERTKKETRHRKRKMDGGAAQDPMGLSLYSTVHHARNPLRPHIRHRDYDTGKGRRTIH